MQYPNVDRGPVARTFQVAGLLLVLLGVVAIFVHNAITGTTDRPAMTRHAPAAATGTDGSAKAESAFAAAAVRDQRTDTATVDADAVLPAGSHPAASIDLGALTLDSDFTVFMRKEVPEDVRRVALRKLWKLMDLPVSCMELCIEPEPPSAVRLAGERGAQ